MGMISVKECTSADDVRAAALAAAAMRKRFIGNPRAPEPVRPDVPAVIHKFTPPKRWIAPVEMNAHVHDWYRAECARLGKKVSELQIILGKYEDDTVQRNYVPDIIRKMSRHYGVSVFDIKSDRRTKKIVFPRQKMMWVAKQITPCSYPEIGRHFGGRDHTTVLHAERKIDALIASNDPSVSDLKGWMSE